MDENEIDRIIWKLLYKKKCIWQRYLKSKLKSNFKIVNTKENRSFSIRQKNLESIESFGNSYTKKEIVFDNDILNLKSKLKRSMGFVTQKKQWDQLQPTTIKSALIKNGKKGLLT